MIEGTRRKMESMEHRFNEEGKLTRGELDNLDQSCRTAIAVTDALQRRLPASVPREAAQVGDFNKELERDFERIRSRFVRPTA